MLMLIVPRSTVNQTRPKRAALVSAMVTAIAAAIIAAVVAAGLQFTLTQEGTRDFVLYFRNARAPTPLARNIPSAPAPSTRDSPFPL
jgi:hypothetical protein